MDPVLLVRMSSLGDIVHTFPAVTDLMRERPGTVLHWVVEEQYVDLARMHPGVARVIPVALRRWRQLGRAAGRGAWGEFQRFRAALRETDYAAVIDSQGLLKSVLVARQARGPLYGFGWRTAREPLAALCYRHTVNFPASAHKIARYRGLMAAANGYAAGHDIDYGLTAPPAPAWAPVAAYAVLLHSTARAAKLWHEAAWISLAQTLAARGVISVLPFGNAAEEARARRIAAAVPAALVPPVMGFIEAAGLLAHARTVIGLDTGFTHLAAAFNTPVVGVFCDSEPVDAHPAGMGPTAYCGAIGRPPLVAEVIAALDRVAPGLATRVVTHAA